MFTTIYTSQRMNLLLYIYELVDNVLLILRSRCRLPSFRQRDFLSMIHELIFFFLLFFLNLCCLLQLFFQGIMRQIILLGHCHVIIIVFKTDVITLLSWVTLFKIGSHLPDTIGLPTRLKIDTVLSETMADQLVPPMIRFMAIKLITFINFILGMPSLMLILIATRGKSFLAKTTFKGPFTCVDSLVHHEIRLILKQSTTNLVFFPYFV